MATNNKNSTNKKLDPYEILGVDKNATTETIEKKFRKLAVKVHPDKNKNDPSADEKFKQLSKAKEILTNPELREKYDRYGIIDEQDEIKMNNEMMQEMMMKQRLREVIQIGISISEILNENGFKKKLNLQREVINSVQRKQYTENFDITLEFDSTKPVNKPIVFEGKGKKYDDQTGDLVIMLNIKPDKTYKINKSNYNLVTTQKISVAQSLCGFEFTLPYSGKGITIQHDKFINPNNVYILKGKGLNVSDDTGNLTKSDIEIHFDIKYQEQLSSDQIEKLKEVFGYKYTKSTCSDKTIQTMKEVEFEKDSNTDEGGEMFEQIFGGGGFPFAQMGGIPGMGSMGGMGSMRGARVFTSGGAQMGGMGGMGGNGQECHVQ